MVEDENFLARLKKKKQKQQAVSKWQQLHHIQK